MRLKQRRVLIADPFYSGLEATEKRSSCLFNIEARKEVQIHGSCNPGCTADRNYS